MLIFDQATWTLLDKCFKAIGGFWTRKYHGHWISWQCNRNGKCTYKYSQAPVCHIMETLQLSSWQRIEIRDVTMEMIMKGWMLRGARNGKNWQMMN